MPKKTRKQKLLAQRRRSLLQRKETPAPVIPAHTASSPASDTFMFSMPEKHAARKGQSSSAASFEYGAIRRDLIKTIVITTVLITAEILIAVYLPR